VSDVARLGVHSAPRLVLAENGLDFLPAIGSVDPASLDQIDLRSDHGVNVIGGVGHASDAVIEAVGVVSHRTTPLRFMR